MFRWPVFPISRQPLCDWTYHLKRDPDNYPNPMYAFKKHRKIFLLPFLSASSLSFCLRDSRMIVHFHLRHPFVGILQRAIRLQSRSPTGKHLRVSFLRRASLLTFLQSSIGSICNYELPGYSFFYPIDIFIASGSQRDLL